MRSQSNNAGQRKSLAFRLLRLLLVLAAVWLCGVVAILQYGRSQANEGISPSEVAGELLQVFTVGYGLISLFILSVFGGLWTAESEHKRP
jgi:hypothetical protein